jgi:hypothetical protein
MKLLLAILLCLLAPTAKAQTFWPRIQVDLVCANQTTVNTLSNRVVSAIGTNTLRGVRDADFRQTIEPAGGIRIFLMVELGNYDRASNIWATATANQPANVHGTVALYCLPDEGAVKDWGGADADARARRVEVAW